MLSIWQNKPDVSLLSASVQKRLLKSKFVPEEYLMQQGILVY